MPFPGSTNKPQQFFPPIDVQKIAVGDMEQGIEVNERELRGKPPREKVKRSETVDVDTMGLLGKPSKEQMKHAETVQGEYMTGALKDVVETVPGLVAAEVLVFNGSRKSPNKSYMSHNDSHPAAGEEDDEQVTQSETNKSSLRRSDTNKSLRGAFGSLQRSGTSVLDEAKGLRRSGTAALAEIMKAPATSGNLLVRACGGCYIHHKNKADATVTKFMCDAEGEEAVPGVSFAGLLWSEAAATEGKLNWRKLQEMEEDPEVPHDDRTELAAKAFGQVGTVSLPRKAGVLLLYSKLVPDHPKELTLLRSRQVKEFVRVASQSIAAHVAMHSTRTMIDVMREQLEEEIEADKEEEEEEDAAATQTKRSGRSERLLTWFRNYLVKCKGGGSKAPGRADWVATVWTFFGVFLTLLIMSGLNELLFEVTEGEYFVLVGSFGALLTLLFGATASPLCQPRNTIFGGIWSAAVAVAMRYLSGDDHLGVLPSWLAVALAPAVAIAGMLKLGVLHPPAGAASLIFIAGSRKITDLGFMYLLLPLLVGNLVCIAMAILFNNLNKKRQYPLFW